MWFVSYYSDRSSGQVVDSVYTRLHVSLSVVSRNNDNNGSASVDVTSRAISEKCYDVISGRT